MDGTTVANSSAPGSPQLLAEFSKHHSYRSVASFFLGFVFITCIHYSIHILHFLFHRLRSYLFGRRHSTLPLIGHSALERGQYQPEKVNHWLSASNSFSPTSVSSASTWAYRPFSNNLALALTICFGMASLAQFGGLLAFEKSQLGGCAFLVAWTDLAGQSARLLGLIRLSLDMRKLGVHKIETYVFWVGICAGMVIMFVDNGFSVGTLVPSSRGPDLCFRDRHIALALLQSLLNLLLELYAVVRIVTLVVPTFLSLRHRIESAWDIRVLKALSLLVLDIATVVPAAKFFSVLVDTIPGSLATLLVLAAFNRRTPEMEYAPTASIPASERHESMIRSPDTNVINIKSPSVRSGPYAASRISHPFSATALQDQTPETEYWPATAAANPSIPEPAAMISPRSPQSPRSPRKSRYRRTRESTDSEVARSVKGAIVGFAFKDMVGQRRKSRSDRMFSPMLGTPVTLRVPSPAAQARSRPAAHVSDESSRGSSGSFVSTPTPSTKATKSGSTSSRSTKTNGSSFHLTPSTPLQRGLSVLTSVTLHTDRDGNDWPGDGMSSPRRDSQISESGLSNIPSPTRLPPADDDLSIVYEASHEESETPAPRVVGRRPTTFGESALVGLSGTGVEAYPFVSSRGRGTPSSGVPEDVLNGSGSGSSRR